MTPGLGWRSSCASWKWIFVQPFPPLCTLVSFETYCSNEIHSMRYEHERWLIPKLCLIFVSVLRPLVAATRAPSAVWCIEKALHWPASFSLLLLLLWDAVGTLMLPPNYSTIVPTWTWPSVNNQCIFILLIISLDNWCICWIPVLTLLLLFCIYKAFKEVQCRGF